MTNAKIGGRATNTDVEVSRKRGQEAVQPVGRFQRVYGLELETLDVLNIEDADLLSIAYDSPLFAPHNANVPLP